MKRQLHRKVSADHFVRIPNKTVRESKLTPEALGVLVYLLSHSETFDHWRNKVMNDFGIGIRKYSRIMTELEKAGFILRKKGGAKGGATLHITDTEDGLSDVCKTRTSQNVDIDKTYTHKKKKFNKNINKTLSNKNSIENLNQSQNKSAKGKFKITKSRDGNDIERYDGKPIFSMSSNQLYQACQEQDIYTVGKSSQELEASLRSRAWQMLDRSK